MSKFQEYQRFVNDHPSLQTIGNTPIVQLDLPFEIGEAQLFAKCENLNPGGSIKDRPVMTMIVHAILSGKLDKSKTILDATSGNAGISYAMIGSMLGFNVTLVMPENASEERKKRIISHGANIIFTDAMLGYDESLHEVKRIYKNNPEKYFYCDQYSNENNPSAHYNSTGSELIKQLPEITHFVAGIGTGGTISGVGKKLKEYNPNIQIIGINPTEWPGIEGLKPLGEGHIIPETFNEEIVDQLIDIDVEEAFKISKTLAANGFFVGQSSGAYVLGALETAKKTRTGQIATIFNDLGERYFSTNMWGLN